jgi:hypothetical protein
MENSLSSGANSCTQSQGILRHFMEYKGSFLCTQEPAIGPYSYAHELSPQHQVRFLLRFILYHLPNLYLGSPSGLSL